MSQNVSSSSSWFIMLWFVGLNSIMALFSVFVFWVILFWFCPV